MTLVAVAVAIPLGLWVRDSPIFAVDHVHVTGVSGSQASDVRQALVAAAQGMSTLHVDAGKLRNAVGDYPIVRDIAVHRHLLHSLDIEVSEYVPVGALEHGGRRLAVAADGTILPGTLTQGLPVVPVGAPPGGSKLAERKALELVALVAAAPAALRAHVSSVSLGPHGLTARLRHGPQLYFGPGTRLRDKWLAAATVLQDQTSRGATYLDLRVPERPAAGGVIEVQEPVTPAPSPQAQVETAVTANPPAQVETPASATTVAP